MKEKYFYPSRAKGGRECGIPIIPSTHQALERYLTISRPRLLKHAKRNVEELFVTNDGGPLSITMVNKIFDKYRGKNMRMHPHAMRRACAVHMLKNGASVRDVQVLLGHRNLESTRHYTALLADDLKNMQDKHHPREKRSKLFGKSLKKNENERIDSLFRRIPNKKSLRTQS